MVEKGPQVLYLHYIPTTKQCQRVRHAGLLTAASYGATREAFSPRSRQAALRTGPILTRQGESSARLGNESGSGVGIYQSEQSTISAG